MTHIRPGDAKQARNGVVASKAGKRTGDAKTDAHRAADAFGVTIARKDDGMDTNDEQVERLARVIQRTENIDQSMTLDSYQANLQEIARAALEAMQPVALEDALNAIDAQRIVLSRMRHTSPHRWSAAIQTRYCTFEDPQGIALDVDPVEAIRAAVRDVKAGEE